MLGLFGYPATIRSIGLAVGKDGPATPGDYRGWLAGFQPAVTIGQGQGLEFVTDEAEQRQLLAFFIEGSDELQERAELVAEGGDEQRSRVVNALQALEQRSPSRKAIFDLVVTRIFTTRIKGVSGGSIASAIGVVWANPPSKATDEDVVEFLVHEMAHTLGYIDEVSSPHFRRPQDGEQVMARSAVRGMERPLYHVLHSLLVACELLAFRRESQAEGELRLHPQTEVLLSQSRESIDSVLRLSWSDIFTARGIAVVLAIQHFLAGYRPLPA